MVKNKELTEEFKAFCHAIYVKLVYNAYYAVSDEIFRDAGKYYKKEENFKKASFMWNVRTALFSLSPKYWEENNKDFSANYTYRYMIAKRYAQEFPESAYRTLGFCELFSTVNMMRKVCENTNKNAAVDFLNTFYELLNGDPEINDVDLLIAFVKKEHIVRKGILPKLELIPPEAKANVNLHLRELLNNYASDFNRGLAAESIFTEPICREIEYS